MKREAAGCPQNHTGEWVSLGSNKLMKCQSSPLLRSSDCRQMVTSARTDDLTKVQDNVVVYFECCWFAGYVWVICAHSVAEFCRNVAVLHQPDKLSLVPRRRFPFAWVWDYSGTQVQSLVSGFIQCILARMVIVLKLVVALAAAAILRCTHVEGQVPTCKSIII